MVALNNLPPLANSELADVFIVICDLFQVDDSLLLSASAKPSHTDCIHVTNQDSVTSLHLLPPAGSCLQADTSVGYLREACDWSVNLQLDGMSWFRQCPWLQSLACLTMYVTSCCI